MTTETSTWFGRRLGTRQAAPALPLFKPPAFPEIEAPMVSEAREKAIVRILGHGYEIDGERRQVRSVAHVLFLARLGCFELPD